MNLSIIFLGLIGLANGEICSWFLSQCADASYALAPSEESGTAFNDTACCFPTCQDAMFSNYTCPVNFTLTTDQAVPVTDSAEYNNSCCVEHCAPSGTCDSRIEWDGMKLCPYPNGCETNDDCCRPVCSDQEYVNRLCQTGWNLKSNLETITITPGTSFETMCCESGVQPQPTTPSDTCSNFPALDCGTSFANRRDDDDGHTFQGGESAFETECCYNECSEGDFTCFANETFADGSRCWGGSCTKVDCCKATCFLNFQGTCTAPARPREEDDEHVPSSGVYDENECCVSPGTCVTEGHQCPAGDQVRFDRDCSMENGVPNCDDDQCCENPLQKHCRSEDAQECADCARHAPCQNSIDPRCISTDALDCLPCKAKNVSLCAVCAPFFDAACVSVTFYGASGCGDDDKEYAISEKADGSCFAVPSFLDEGHQKITMNATHITRVGSCNDDCTDCISNEQGTYIEIFGDPAVSSDDGDCFPVDDGSYDMTGTPTYEPLTTPLKCPSADPCGPAACVPGSDAKCVVFTVFAATSTCEVVEDVTDYETKGDYHAFAIADGTCRLDGSGRSYYKLNAYKETEDGVGVIGCQNDACTVGCTDVSMAKGECSSPSWANGLKLTVNAVLDDFDGVVKPVLEEASVKATSTMTLTEKLTDTQKTAAQEQAKADLLVELQAAGVAVKSVTVTLTEGTTADGKTTYTMDLDVTVEGAKDDLTQLKADIATELAKPSFKTAVADAVTPADYTGTVTVDTIESKEDTSTTTNAIDLDQSAASSLAPIGAVSFAFLAAL